MVDQELLSAIGAMMEKAVAPINERLDRLEQGQDELKNQVEAMAESLEEVRSGVNTLLEWADDVAVKVEVPLRPAQ